MLTANPSDVYWYNTLHDADYQDYITGVVYISTPLAFHLIHCWKVPIPMVEKKGPKHGSIKNP